MSSAQNTQGTKKISNIYHENLNHNETYDNNLDNSFNQNKSFEHLTFPPLYFLFNQFPREDEPYIVCSSYEPLNSLAKGPLFTSYSMYFDIYKQYPKKCTISLLEDNMGSVSYQFSKKLSFITLNKYESVTKIKDKVEQIKEIEERSNFQAQLHQNLKDNQFDWKIIHFCEDTSEKRIFLALVEDEKFVHLLKSNTLSNLNSISFPEIQNILPKSGFIYSDFTLEDNLQQCFNTNPKIQRNNRRRMGFRGGAGDNDSPKSIELSIDESNTNAIGQERLYGFCVFNLDTHAVCFTQLSPEVTKICVNTILTHETTVKFKSSRWRKLSPAVFLSHDLLIDNELLSITNDQALKLSEILERNTIHDNSNINDCNFKKQQNTRVICSMKQNIAICALISLEKYTVQSKETIEILSKSIFNRLQDSITQVINTINSNFRAKNNPLIISPNQENTSTIWTLPKSVLAVATKKNCFLYISQNQDLKSFIPKFHSYLDRIIIQLEEHPKRIRSMIYEDGVYYVAKRFETSKTNLSKDILIFASLELNSKIEMLIQMELKRIK